MLKLKSFSLFFLYIYSLSFVYAFFIAYGLGDGDIFLATGLTTNMSFFIQSSMWALIPSFAITAVFILLNPYSFICEICFYLFVTFISILTISNAVIFQSPLDVPAIYIMLYSGAGEVKVFFETFSSLKLAIILLITCLLPLYLWKIARRNKCSWTLKDKGILFILSICLLLIPMHRPGLIAAGISWRGGFDISSVDRNLRRLFYIEYLTYLPKAIQLGKLETSIPTDVHSLFEGTQNIIIIIAESSNRNQFSLYGYPRKTTPKLDELDLIVYQDVLSPSPVTSRSIPHMLTFSNLQSNEQLTTIYDFFKVAGFTSYYFDGYGGVNYNDIIHLIGARADNRFRREQYDKDLFDAALAVIKNDPTEKKLILIHPVTAHFPYTTYPETMEEFSGTPPELYPGAEPYKRNQYDTAISYLDDLIGSFLENIADEKNTAVVVTADHGQEVANYSTIYGHSNSTRFLSCYEVPFFLYLSKDYKKTLNDLVFDTARPYQTDNLIHSIIDLAHIKSPLFKPEYSIFNKAYQEPIQMVQSKKYTELKKEAEEKRNMAMGK